MMSSYWENDYFCSRNYRLMKQLFKGLNMIRQCDRRSFWFRIFYVVVLSLLPLLNLYILKFLVDSVTNNTIQMFLGIRLNTIMLLGAFCLVFLINRLISVLNGVNSDIMAARLADYLSARMQEQSARLDMSYFDNPSYHDTYHRAQAEGGYKPMQIMDGFMGAIGSIITIGGIVVMLVSASRWIILVMIVAVLPSFVVRLVKARKKYAFSRENTQNVRRASYYTYLLNSKDSAKEMRTFGLTSYFRERFVKVRSKYVNDLIRITRRMAVFDMTSAIVEMAALFFVTLFLINCTSDGSISVGSFVMLFEAFRRGQSQLSSLVNSITGLYDNRLFIGNLFEFLDLEPTIVNDKSPLPFPEKVESVEFRDITFRYPKMNHDVLKHYDLVAKAGNVTQIEGENGFGKTTLLKLLLRLYDTDEGVVLINGVDIRKYDLKELRQGIGAVFQDFVRFYCTAEENISFGNVSHFDSERVKYVANLTGADTFIDRLPKGYETPLGRLFDDGEELSMGQWQRVALARQLYSNAPVLVFDEPTAWMDVPSRDRFYKTLESMKNEGKVIILIKHV